MSDSIDGRAPDGGLYSQETPDCVRSDPDRALVPPYLPARMVNEYVYCPRLFYYEWVEGLFAHNDDTVEGAVRHAGLDAAPKPLSSANEQTDDLRVARSVELSSDAYGLIAKMDLVESGEGGVRPVEYKKGRPRQDDRDGATAWPSDRVQAAVQALILRDNGYRCDAAVLYYSETKQRVVVPLDDALKAETERAIADSRAAAHQPLPPEPLEDSPKCPRCSLVGICLPDETWVYRRAASARSGRTSGTAPAEECQAPTEEMRRLVPARDDQRPLYVAGYGLTVGKSGEVLRITSKDGPVQEVRIGELTQVNLLGNVQITAPAIHSLCESDRPIAHFSHGGWFYGLTQGLGLKNVFLRKSQFSVAEDPEFCRRVARRLVYNKIRNQRRMIARNHVQPDKTVLRELQRHAEAAAVAEDMPTLLGVEGAAARSYFGVFAGMIKTDEASGAAGGFSFDFEGRNRRPPRDPVNALLSFAYALLAKDLTIVCATIGFDPFIGFYHQPRFGRPALALDLMEPFRPLIADSVVLAVVNTRMVGLKDFVRSGGAVALSGPGRKAFLHAYSQRMDSLITHPIFGYRISYRRVLEVQARLLARVVSGEVEVLPSFETR